MIPYGRQHITDEGIKAVVDVLKSDYLTQGSIVPEFERAVCDYTGATYAAAVNTILEKMQLFRCHGITRDPEKMTQVADGPWHYQYKEAISLPIFPDLHENQQNE